MWNSVSHTVVKLVSENRGAKSIHRALDLLGILREHSSGLTLTELAQQLSLPKSTVHRILNTLLEHQFVREMPQQGRYALGYEVLRLSQACLESLDLVREAHPKLEALNSDLDETVLLGILDDSRHQVIYLDKLDSSQTVRLVSHIGERAPVHCTALGKAALSCLESAELMPALADYEFEQFTERTIVDMETLLKELAEVRERGYAVDFQEYRPQVTCVAAPIRNHAGQPLAVVSVSAPSGRLGPQKQEEVGRRVVEVVEEISELLAHMPSQEVR